jgi:hypothetical protein
MRSNVKEYLPVLHQWIALLYSYAAFKNQLCNLFLDLLVITKDKFFCHQHSSLPKFLLS